MKEEVNEKYNQLILALDKNDPTYEARKYSLESRGDEDLDSINSMCAHRKKAGKKRTFYEIEKKLENTLKSKTTKMIVDFCSRELASIKSFAIKKNNQVKVATRFLSGKMLMFTKLSLVSFIYEMLQIFCFPDEKVQKIFDKYLIEKVYIYHVLMDTESTCLQFLFISDPKSGICEKKY